MDKVKFSNIEQHPLVKSRLSFAIDNMHVGIANALRRVILSEIPNIAVGFDPYDKERDDCNFIINTSSLHNEFLGHRLSMIPINLPPHVIDDFDPNEYKFVIDLKNEGAESLTVTTNNIRVYKNGIELTREESNKIFPPDEITGDYIIITKLKPNLYDLRNGEKLHVEFKARKGIAKHNAAWCPVSLCTYSFTVDEEAASKGLETIMASLEDPGERENARKVFMTLDRQRYYKPHSFTFAIQSECALTPTYIFSKAFDVLSDKLIQLASQTLDICEINGDQNLYAITINGEDHTIGNLLQVMLYELYIQEKKEVTYAGYIMPHPLEQKLILKVRFNKSVDVHAFFERILKEFASILKNIQTLWDQFVSEQNGKINKTTTDSTTLQQKAKRTVVRRKK